MTERTPYRVKCDSVAYRQGFLEVTPGIHNESVNLEMWNLNADTNLADVKWLDDPSIQDSSVIANVELELSAAQARTLAEALLAAAAAVER